MTPTPGQLVQTSPVALVPRPVHLPAELLLMIFKFVYASLRATFLRKYRPWHERKVKWRREDLMSRSLFPFSVAAVSPAWRDISSLVPEFWTRVVIPVDRATVSIVQSYLQWSRNLPIEVYIVSPSGIDPEEERARMQVIMMLLSPHIHRCAAIRIQATWGSSLPVLKDHLLGLAQNLRVIRMSSKDISFPPDVLYQAPGGAWLFYSPALERLELDAQNFREACVDLYRWFRALPKMSSLKISGSRCRSAVQRDRVSLHDVLMLASIARDLPSMRFEMKDVDFETDVIPSPFRYRPMLTRLTLKGISHESIRSFFRAYPQQFPPDVTFIERCSLGTDTRVEEYSSYFLNLIDLDGNEDLFYFLSGWGHLELTLRNCPCFNDTLLNRIADEWEANKLGSDYMRPMNTIRLDRCQNFSISALKRLVEVRNKIFALQGREFSEDDEHLDPFCRLGYLSITNGPPMSQDDVQWFEDALEAFHWEQGSYCECAGDGDSGTEPEGEEVEDGDEEGKGGGGTEPEGEDEEVEY
ncbi:hypothetical protein BV22DRAFT_1066444 [Leucogyrophana mollusca]|uniref:Uncharacterized protein n=1 Tax=Leucogyrophana mollusca TaxID=85980 RepID=A0ACB8BFZ1_9AGAM|nr:hypothetical protein BV22DRAFT_1066444 [Leucogyrophana mollusca]